MLFSEGTHVQQGSKFQGVSEHAASGVVVEDVIEQGTEFRGSLYMYTPTGWGGGVHFLVHTLRMGGKLCSTPKNPHRRSPKDGQTLDRIDPTERCWCSLCCRCCGRLCVVRCCLNDAVVVANKNNGRRFQESLPTGTRFDLLVPDLPLAELSHTLELVHVPRP